MVFFRELEEEDTESDPSNEQVQAIQGLLENTGAAGGPNMESRDLDRSICYDADENKQELPLASSQTKPVKGKNVLEWIEGMVDEIIDGRSQI